MGTIQVIISMLSYHFTSELVLWVSCNAHYVIYIILFTLIVIIVIIIILVGWGGGVKVWAGHLLPK